MSSPVLPATDFAGALLGPAIVNPTEFDRTRDRILQTITDVAFRPVFQRIADLATGEFVGYETLTRFSAEFEGVIRSIDVFWVTKVKVPQRQQRRAR